MKFEGFTPEQRNIQNQRDAYEKEAKQKAKEENTVFENLTGGGVKKEDIIRADAEKQDKFETGVRERFSTGRLTGIVGSELHDEWRAPRKKEDGTFEPRIKKTKDQAWSQTHGGAVEVDIANTAYAELPEDWKGENKISAEVAVGEITKALQEKRELDEKFIEDASSVLHVKWLERNGSWAPPEQNKPYAELSEEEKEKDRVIIRKAIEKQKEMEQFKKGFKIAKEVVDEVHPNGGVAGKYWCLERSTEIDWGKVNQLIVRKARENNLSTLAIRKCIEGSGSRMSDYRVGLVDPYSRPEITSELKEEVLD